MRAFFLRSIRDFLSARTAEPVGSRPFVPRAATTDFLRTFYILLLCASCVSFATFLRRAGAVEGQWLWPVGWLSGFDPVASAYVLYCFLLGAVSAAVLAPRALTARIVVLLSLFLMVALANSYGKIDHPFHGWIFAVAMLVFVPHGESRLRDRQQARLAIWGAQASFLCIYFCVGIWKLRGLAEGFERGLSLAEHLAKSLPHHLAWNVVQGAQPNPASELIMRHPYLAALAWTGSVYLEAGSLFIAFRPRLHPAWGILIILFHAGTYVLMDIIFFPAMLLAAALLVNSPFHDGGKPLAALAQLPGIAWLVGIARASRRRPERALLNEV